MEPLVSHRLDSHPLYENILFQKLSDCPNLSTLGDLVDSHHDAYAVFNNNKHRRQILRSVFKKQYISKKRPVGPSEQDDQILDEADTFIRNHIITFAHHGSVTRSELNNDRLAFREALWPYLQPKLPAARSVSWATDLFEGYIAAIDPIDPNNLNDLNDLNDPIFKDAYLAFKTAKRIVGLYTRTPRYLTESESNEAQKGTYLLFEKILQVYAAAGRHREAIAVAQYLLDHFNSGFFLYRWEWYHLIVKVYSRAGETARLVKYQHDMWTRNNHAVDDSAEESTWTWAMRCIKECQMKTDYKEAVQLLQEVNKLLGKTPERYLKWHTDLLFLFGKFKRPEKGEVNYEERMEFFEAVWSYELESGGST